MFVKIIAPGDSSTLIECTSAHWRLVKDDSGNPTGGIAIWTVPGMEEFYPSDGSEVYFLSDTGKTVDALHWPKQLVEAPHVGTMSKAE